LTTIKTVTTIRASREQCFDLARSQKAHTASAEATSERIVSGPANDLLTLGDEVTFEGRHFGIRFRLTARITESLFPEFFVDETVKGPFQSMRHEHRFEACAEGTQMIDILTFKAPFGPIGLLAEKLFLSAHLTRFLKTRGEFLRSAAERNRTTDHADGRR